MKGDGEPPLKYMKREVMDDVEPIFDSFRDFKNQIEEIQKRVGRVKSDFSKIRE